MIAAVWLLLVAAGVGLILYGLQLIFPQLVFVALGIVVLSCAVAVGRIED